MIITAREVIIFFLVFGRMLGMMMYAPLFSRRDIIVLSKVAFMFWSSLIIFFVVPLPDKIPNTGLTFFLAILVEVLIGALIGFTTDLLVTGIEFAGTLMDTQAGLSVANLLDPASGRQSTLISLLLKWMATLLFLILDGHHLVLSALYKSYELLPIASPVNLARGALQVVEMGTYVFYLAVQLSAPILLVVFLIDFGFGILNKVAEQINVFQLGFQLKPSVVLIIFLAMAPGLVQSIMQILQTITEYMIKLLTVMSI